MSNQEEEICSICLDNLSDEKSGHWPGCGHRFHRKCAEAYFERLGKEASCPMCRRKNEKWEAQASGLLSPPTPPPKEGEASSSNEPVELPRRANRRKTIFRIPKQRDTEGGKKKTKRRKSKKRKQTKKRRGRKTRGRK